VQLYFFMRSRTYKEVKTQIDKNKAYPIDEAIGLLKKVAKTKFDSGVELHLNLGIDTKAGDQQIRSSVTLPHGTGKSKRIAAFTSDPAKAKKAGATIAGAEELIDEIKKTEKTDFDVAVAEPAMMKNLAKIAKTLGTRGLMPSPKTGTVTPDIEKAIKELTGGKINFKNDDTANIHQLIGKISWESDKLKQNIETFLDAINKAKPATSKGEYIKSATLCTTMSPGIRVAV